MLSYVKSNKKTIESLVSKVFNLEKGTPFLTFANLTSATAFWNDSVDKPTDNTMLFIEDLNQYFKWDSLDSEKATFSRDLLDVQIQDKLELSMALSLVFN